MHIVNIMCILSTDAYVMYISFLLLLSVICILSEHMHIMRTLSAVVLDIFLSNRQCRCHPYVISSTLYISYHVQLSFCTLSAQIHIVHVICMLSTHVHIICLSSLPLLIYLIVTDLNFEITFVNNTLSSTMCFKYCISLNFRPSIMEFPTSHLALCNRVYLSGCSQFKQVGTRSNQLDLVPVCII